jgi:predicted peptidase
MSARCCWIALAACVSLAVPARSDDADRQDAGPPTGFIYQTLEHDGETYAYSVFVPPEYTPDRAWPVILFLHGSGESGDDGFLQTEVGIGTAIRKNYRRVPAIVVMPQCRTNQAWVGKMAEMALRCVEETSRKYHLDPQRFYLTGLSLGGHGTWHIAAAYPGKFAAIVPICGFAELGQSTGLAAKLARRLRDVPVWCFHGANDDRVPVSKAREMVTALREAGGNVQYTEYPDGRHVIWDRVYEDPQLWKWLFAQKLDNPAGRARAPKSAAGGVIAPTIRP